MRYSVKRWKNPQKLLLVCFQKLHLSVELRIIEFDFLMNNSPVTYQPSVPVSDEFDLKSWFFRIVSLWPWFLSLIALSLISSWIIIKNTELVYLSSASIMIKDDKKTGSSSTMDNNVLKALNISGSGKLLENEIEVLKSADLIREVVLSEQLYISTMRLQPFADRTVFGSEQPFRVELANPNKIISPTKWVLKSTDQGWQLHTGGNNNLSIVWGAWYQWNGVRFRFFNNSLLNKDDESTKPNVSDFEVRLNSVENTVLNYKKNLDIKQVGKQSTVINISVQDGNAKRGKAFLSTLIRFYNEQGLNDKNLTTSNTIDFLDERLAVVESELRNVEGTVETFKRSNRVTDVSEQAKVYLEMTKEIDRRKAEQETQVNLINALERELNTLGNNARLVPSTLGVADPSAARLIEQHNSLILQRERVASLAGPKNPALADIDNQVSELRLNLLENVRNLRNGYIMALNDVKLQDQRLNDRLVNLPALERQLLEISRDRNVKQQIYLFLLQKREESAIALASSVIDSRSVESPRTIKKVKPQNGFIYAVGLAIGLLLALIPMLLIDFLDDKVGSVREVIERTGLPFLGELNYVKNLKNTILISEKKRDLISEQIRAIRTNISFTGRGSEVRKILFSSQIPGEGKTFSSLNIAMSYVLLGKKVAILEFDLRKPRLIKNLGLTSTKGISNYLSGQCNLPEIILNVEHTLGYPLHIIPSGPIPPNPSELILSERMACLIKDLEGVYDYIFIDSPPFGLVTDAMLLKQYSDIVVIVMRQGYSRKEVYRDVIEKFKKETSDSVYIILNGVNRFGRYSYYSTRYNDYRYKYGYGYSNKSRYGYSSGSSNNEGSNYYSD